MAAAKGNQYAKNGRLIRQAIKKAIARKHGSVSEGLIKIFTAHVEKAELGDAQSFNTILDRIAGKAHQTVEANVTNTIVDLRDATTLEDKLKAALTGRLEQPAEPKKRTLQ